MYKPDKKQVLKLRKTVHKIQKQLPVVKDVQHLVAEKKKVHRKVTLNQDVDEVSITSDFKNLHYS